MEWKFSLLGTISYGTFIDEITISCNIDIDFWRTHTFYTHTHTHSKKIDIEIRTYILDYIDKIKNILFITTIYLNRFQFNFRNDNRHGISET